MRIYLSILFAFAVATCAVGTTAARQADDRIFPYSYEMRDLPNGLRVIVIPTDFPNIVALQIPVSVGSRDEVEPGKTGFAHFFEHMMFRGSENFTAEEYTQIMTNAGADQNAWTSDDLTNYHVTFSKEDLDKILEIEADRFIRLQYSEDDFKTEARAILGEYNTSNMNPFRRLFEAQRTAAFDEHTYRHTALGTLEDIMDMPNQYEYSLEFYDRYYRPDNIAIILAGDLDVEETFRLVEEYWGDWEPGAHETQIPEESAPDGPRYTHIEWATPTLPLLYVGFHGPAWSETEVDMAAAQLIGSMAFGSSSELYQKLVIDERVVDQFGASFPERVDPYLLNISARVTQPEQIWYVRDEIHRTLADLRTNLVSEQRLEDIKSNVRYSFANAMDNSETIAAVLVNYVARTGDPESMNRTFALMNRVTPEDIRRVANTYFTDDRMVVATLSRDELAETESNTGSVDAKLAEVTPSDPAEARGPFGGAVPPPPALPEGAASPAAEVRTVLLPSESPLVDFRILFNVGAASDPAGKEGLATLTAAMVSDAGSEAMRYSEIQQALFPIASGFGSQVDKEMTVFTGRTHRDNLDRYYNIVSGQLLEPAWREADFERVKRNIVNGIRVSLRDNNEEELGKEVLYETIYAGHPYGHLNAGHISAIEALTIDDVREFYRSHYTNGNVVLGMAGGYSEAFLGRVKGDLARGLSSGNSESKISLPQPETPSGMEVTILQKETRATAISMGFPIQVNRAHPDFAALWLASSYFGEHRSFLSHLFQRIREVRGMNYGSYSYIEYFPRGMFQFYPDANLARQQQIFQIWIRPVEPDNAHFALRIAKYELDKLVEAGLTQEQFESTRNYLTKFVNVLTKSQGRQLGYALDSDYYGTDKFTEHIRSDLARLTLDDVNRVIREHLSSDGIAVVMITRDAEGLRDRLISGETSPIEYDAPRPPEVLAEDVVIQDYPLGISTGNVRIVPVEEVFE